MKNGNESKSAKPPSFPGAPAPGKKWQRWMPWIVVDKSRFHVSVPWRLVYADRRYALYHRTA